MAYVGVRQLRAYIYPWVKGIQKFSLTEPIEITVALKNAGQTPARDCECSSVVFVATLPMDDDAKMTEPAEPSDLFQHSKIAIYPEAELRITCISINILSDAIVGPLRARKAAIYVAERQSTRICSGSRVRPNFAGTLIQRTKIC
jgi:hypothetical protein